MQRIDDSRGWCQARPDAGKMQAKLRLRSLERGAHGGLDRPCGEHAHVLAARVSAATGGRHERVAVERAMDRLEGAGQAVVAGLRHEQAVARGEAHVREDRSGGGALERVRVRRRRW